MSERDVQREIEGIKRLHAELSRKVEQGITQTAKDSERNTIYLEKRLNTLETKIEGLEHRIFKRIQEAQHQAERNAAARRVSGMHVSSS